MTTALEQRVAIPSGDVTLEGVLHRPATASATAAVVVCHPHPLYGGDMDNNVVVAVVRGLLERGIAALRFNFRGVGRSGGQHSGGPGERDDARASLAFLGQQQGIDGQRLGLMGYSFGAGVALGVAPEAPQAQAIVGIACLPSALQGPLLAHDRRPKLFIAGAVDSYIPLEEFQKAVARLSGPKEARVLSNADHFFHGHERELGALVGDFFARHLKGGP